MKSNLTFTLVVGLLLFLVSCGTSVSTDYDRSANFSQYKTYNYYENKNLDNINDIDASRIVQSIDSEMKSKGFTKSDNPDLLVDIYAKEHNFKKTNASVGIGGGSYGRRGIGVNVGVNVPITSKRSNKYLTVDITEAKTHKLLWQSAYEKEMSANAQNTDVIPKAIDKMFKNFPPKK